MWMRLLTLSKKTQCDGKHRARRLFAILGFPLLIAGILAIALIFHRQLTAIFRNPESVRLLVESHGAWSVAVFTGLQILQVVIFIIPGEIVQLAGGYVFGMIPGALLSTLGILAGSLVNFMAGRFLGRAFVKSILSEDKIMRIEKTTKGGKAQAVFFLLFLIPGIPKDALTYVAGMGSLGFIQFILISSIGRFPGILGSSYIGAAVFERDYRGAMIISIIAVILFLAGLIWREKLHNALGVLAEKMGSKKAAK